MTNIYFFSKSQSVMGSSPSKPGMWRKLTCRFIWTYFQHIQSWMLNEQYKIYSWCKSDVLFYIRFTPDFLGFCYKSTAIECLISGSDILVCFSFIVDSFIETSSVNGWAYCTSIYLIGGFLFIPKEFVTVLADKQVTLGENCILSCEARTKNVTVSWMKDDDKLNCVEGKHATRNYGTKYELNISKVEDMDEGKYTITLTNHRGSESCSAMVRVSK